MLTAAIAPTALHKAIAAKQTDAARALLDAKNLYTERDVDGMNSWL